MIVDHIDTAGRYAALHPLFAQAFAFLKDGQFDSLGSGRSQVGRFIAIRVSADGKGRDNARLERHEREIDIHFVESGTDVIGWRSVSDCHESDGVFDVSADTGYFSDRPHVWTALTPRTFAIYLPTDGHAPLAGDGSVTKVILKIPVTEHGGQGFWSALKSMRARWI